MPLKKEAQKKERMEEVIRGVEALEAGELTDLRRKEGYMPVVGAGSLEADLMFVGEAPGETEAKTGLPFQGRSGRVLDELFGLVGLERSEVYITSVVKDRPPQNRDPRPSEIEAYAPFLDRQIEIIEPKVIATLGRFGMQYIMGRYGLSEFLRPISEVHGSFFETTLKYGKVQVYPLFHPAVALYRSKQRQVLREDFQKLKQRLEK